VGTLTGADVGDRLLHLAQQGGAAALAPHRCTKCISPSINGQCTSHRIAVALRFSVHVKGLNMSVLPFVSFV